MFLTLKFHLLIVCLDKNKCTIFCEYFVMIWFYYIYNQRGNFYMLTFIKYFIFYFFYLTILVYKNCFIVLNRIKEIIKKLVNK
jgi:hypothetical protein